MTDLELVRELVRDTCRCGSHKQPHHTFCFRCYGRLSPIMQKALYARLGKGYSEAYHAAVEFFDAENKTGERPVR